MTTIDLFRNAKDAKVFKAGETIFREGESGHEMYVIQTGEVDVLVNGKMIFTEKEGGIIGEMSLVDARPRSASAVARTDCAVVAVEEQRFLFMVQQTPFFALQVMRIMVERLRRRDAIV